MIALGAVADIFLGCLESVNCLFQRFGLAVVGPLQCGKFSIGLV